jgi:hypothetical protein
MDSRIGGKCRTGNSNDNCKDQYRVSKHVIETTLLDTGRLTKSGFLASLRYFFA